jgi:phosphatidylinositol alpha 1,6-mannosyltransferase
MRIALISETFLPNVNGVVTTLCRLLEHLEANGHEAILFAPQGAPKRFAAAEVVPLFGMPLPLYPELQFTPPQSGITARLRRFKPDLIHLAGPAALGATGRHVAKALGVPLVSTYHTDLPSYTTHYGIGCMRDLGYQYLRWIHNGCTLTLCPSSATLDDLRAHGFRRLHLWGRGVDTVAFNPACRSDEWRRSTGLQDGETLLLYVGRLAAEKGLDVLVEAVKEMEGVRLVLVGDGPSRAALAQRLEGAPVHFADYLRGAELSRAYASADLFVFPSDTETFGQVIQEAMAAGLPVVAARAGGAIDIVREGVTGTLFTPGSVREMRGQIGRQVRDNARRIVQGKAGRVAAERRSWSNVMDELLVHYRSITQRRQRRLLRLRRAGTA